MFKFSDVENVSAQPETQSSGFSFSDVDDQPDFTKVKSSDIFSTDGSNTNAPQKLANVNKSWVQKFAESDLGKFGDTQSKAVVSGLYSIGGGVGSMISWYGDNMILEKGALGLDDKTIDRINTFGRGWQKFGEIIKKGSDFVLKDDGLKLDEEIFKGDIIDNPSITRVTSAVMSAVPSLMSMVGIAKATGSTALSYFLMGGVDSVDIYEKSKEKGHDLDKTNLLYTSSMAGTALIDKFLSPVEKILGGNADTIVKKLTKRVTAGLSEGGAEGGQSFWQNLVKKYGIDDSQNLLEGVFESMIGGFGAGAVSSGLFDTASNSLKAKGATQQEIDGAINSSVEYIQNNADDVNNVVYQHLEKGLDNLDKFISENKDEALVAQALEKKKQLETIYNDTFNELKNIMPEQEAKSNAALIRNSAFFFAEELGISPTEFVKQYGAKVVRSDYEQFRGGNQNIPVMQVTQKDINYARSHPEWAKNNAIITAIGQAGADINDDINTINKALKEYSIKEYNFRKNADEGQIKNFVAELDEGKQERYAMMVENGVKPQDAYNAVTYVEDYIPFQTQIADITKQKAREVKNALQEIVSGAEEATVKDLRDDLDQYGGTNDITFIYGDEKKGLFHIADKHGGMKTLLKVLDAVVDGNVIRHVKAKKTVVVEKDGYEAVLSLDEHGNKKTWLLTGWDTKISPDEEREFRATLNSTQLKPTFSRQELGAELDNFIVNEDAEFVNQNVRFQESLDVAKVNAELDKINPAYEGETININGVERTVYNSNGDRIAMSEPALRNFYNWFGDSKVVDEQGRPLVVYHGTNKEFDSFDKKLLGTTTLAYSARQGFFFTDSEDVANSYGDYAAIYQPINELRKKQEMAERWGDWDTVDELTIKIEELDRKISQTPANERGQKIYPVYLKAEDVLEYDAKDEYFSDIGDEINDVLLKAKKQGKDGVVLKNLKDQPLVFDEKSSNHFVVFEPNQIKSTSNRGTYSESDNIYYQSAFAGSRVDYDRPSLEAIGSGEGAQAHGWGLYYALSRDVAEGYRYKFIDKEASPIGINPRDFNLENKNYFMSGNKYYVSDFVGRDVKNSKELSLEEYREKYQEAVRLDKEARERDEKKGQVHEVDIPENPYLLDEQKPFSEQSDFVKERLRELAQTYSDFYQNSDLLSSISDNETGGEFYNLLARTQQNVLEEQKQEGNPKKYASQELESLGIKGITYDGRQDGRCFVIFNPDDVKVIQKFYQEGANDPQGAYVNRIIHLFQNADASTLPHELAHFWKDTLRDVSKMSKRAQKMLEDVEKWAEQEFNRKYSVQKRGTQYVVVNKQGLVVYGDRERVKFYSESDAKSYAQEEIFAQGFETYLKEGVAPNNSLKQAFRNFLSWLKHLLNQGKVLDIRLSPAIKEVYADILGGADIDFFLNTDPDTFIENRIRRTEESERDIDAQIAEAQKTGPVRRKVKKALKQAAQWWYDAVIPLSTRLKRINPKLRTRMRRYEFDVLNNLNKYYQEAKPFLDIWQKFSEEDAIAFDIALKNDYVKKQVEIVEKYGAREEWEKVRKLLLDIFDNGIKAGLDINYRPDYFPRAVEDYDGFMEYMMGRPDWSIFEQALKEADPEDRFTNEEKSEFINKYFRGFVKADIMPSKFGSEKQRRIDYITNEMNQYYKPSIEALISYIEGMNARIEASKFLGRDAENIDSSIGGFVDQLLINKEIGYKDVDTIKRVLKARFTQKGVHNAAIAALRDVTYVYTMGGINSAVTQLEDISVSLYSAGVKNTLKTAFKKKDVKRSDLGLEKIGQEFIDNPSKTAAAVNLTFKLSGLDKIDAWGKETFVNSKIAQLEQMSDKELKEYVEPIMEDRANQTIRDIRNGVKSDDVRFLGYNELSNYQPISLSELPAYYNTGGNYRVFYMLKSFMLKRIDIFRNECYDKIFGDTDTKTKIEGVQNLFRLAILMVMCGVTKDWIINFMYNRIMDLSESVVNNILGLAGISKFQLYQARDKGIEDVIKDFFSPPLLALANDFQTDISKLMRGKITAKDMEIVKGIPLFGRFIYWHWGKGKEKMKKRSGSKLK